MLTLTRDATEAIEQILEAPEMPESAGIRIGSVPLATDSASPSPDAGALRLTVAEEPEFGDEVIDQAGARVFVQDTVAPFLNDKLLDAEILQEGVHFTIGERS